ncbi:MAG: TIGR04282 family arsenosugar biosynthesis glycosyltransferase [Planctomycetes bacterium]|nr:TIGR04282 family arsenosugar biosynthesis glycosyltransferase [Planctomycetota bacterium]
MTSPLKLLVFVRYPEPGKVKTRLAKEVGPERAAAIYRRMAQTVLSVVQPLRKIGVEVRLHGTPAERLPELKDWLRTADTYLPQEGADEGARMERAFSRAFMDGAKSVLLLGTDCIEVTPHGLKRAFEALASTDVVLGPAKSGGYYLLGLRKLASSMFHGVAWGTEAAPKELAERLKQARLSSTELERLREIERVEDVPTGYY